MKFRFIGHYYPNVISGSDIKLNTKGLYDPNEYLDKLEYDGSEIVVDIELKLSKKGNLVALVTGASYT